MLELDHNFHLHRKTGEVRACAVLRPVPWLPMEQPLPEEGQLGLRR